MAADRPTSGWPRGFDESEREQRVRLAALSLAEKLDWLEEAQRLAERIARARESASRDAPADGGA